MQKQKHSEENLQSSHHYIYLLTISTPINPTPPLIVEYSILRLNCTFRYHTLVLKVEGDYFLPLLLHQLFPLHWILAISYQDAVISSN